MGAGTLHYVVLWLFAAYGVYRFAKDIFDKYIYSGDEKKNSNSKSGNK